MLYQASAAGALDLKKIEADFVKGVDKTWAPLVTAGVKKCGPIAASNNFYTVVPFFRYFNCFFKQNKPLLSLLLATSLSAR